ALLMLPGLWRLRHAHSRVGWITFTLAGLSVLLALLAVLGKPLGLPYQHNWAWIAFALPLWIALWLGLVWRRRMI
ncbi:MAG: hypothetical protein L0H70_07495, partial [Xanthomonadales bacterium]|nr:hypothetical protein [Xanthomonadales bacterium]